VKFKLFHSFPENRQHIPRIKPIYSNSREAGKKRMHYTQGIKNQRIRDLFLHAAVAKQNGRRLPFFIPRLYPLHDWLTLSAGRQEIIGDG